MFCLLTTINLLLPHPVHLCVTHLFIYLFMHSEIMVVYGLNDLGCILGTGDVSVKGKMRGFFSLKDLCFRFMI